MTGFHYNLSDLLRQGKGNLKLLDVKNNEIELKSEAGKGRYLLADLPDNVAVIECPDEQNAYFRQKEKQSPSFDKGPTSICDYMILFQNEKSHSKIDILFVELKSNPKDQTQGVQQIICTVPLMYYIVTALRTHFEYEFDDQEMRQHYLLWKQGKSFRKSSGHRESQGSNRPLPCRSLPKSLRHKLSKTSRPNDFYICSDDRLNFSRIIPPT